VKAARTDSNQRAIMAVLRASGCSVQSLHRVGGGVPDLLVARAGVNYLIEVKVPKEKLNTVQRVWHAKWRGEVMVWHSVEDAIEWLKARRT